MLIPNAWKLFSYVHGILSWVARLLGWCYEIFISQNSRGTCLDVEYILIRSRFFRNIALNFFLPFFFGNLRERSFFRNLGFITILLYALFFEQFCRTRKIYGGIKFRSFARKFIQHANSILIYHGLRYCTYRIVSREKRLSEWRNIFFTMIETIYYLPRARFIQNYLYLLSKNDAINFDKARIFQSLESVKSISLDAYSRTLAKNCQLFHHTVKAIKSSKQFKHCEKITGEILASVSDRIDGGCIDLARDSSSGSYEFSNLLSLLGIWQRSYRTY